MKSKRLLHAALAVSCLTATLVAPTPPAYAQAQPAFKPEVGQAGKDVIWVPTPQALVDRMLDMAKLTPKDYLVDLGSGDGRTVITAAKRGARAHGIEYNPDMVALSKQNAEKEGVAGKATFEKADIFVTDFSKATVLTLFLLDSINLKLRPTILGMKPGTRVVSNTFRMGDWEPDETAQIDNCTQWCTAHLWIVPAKVDGNWKLGNRDLQIRQTFQSIEGRISDGNVITPITGKLNGEQITFTGAGRTYTGRVEGSTITGSDWKATRAGS